VLPQIKCTNRRIDFVGRANSILGFFTVISIASTQGSDSIFKAEQEGVFTDDTAFRLNIFPGVASSHLNYGLFKKAFSRAGGNLTNQVFLMLYGNFEAYVADIVLDGLSSENVEDPYQDALNLMVLSKWRGKVDRIGQRLKIVMGKRRFVNKFRDIEMNFLGEPCTDPIEYLEMTAELCHRLVHSGGRMDQDFVDRFSEADLKVDEAILLPHHMPYQVQIFMHLSDLFDGIFGAKYGWERAVIAPEKIVDY
jgi:hypothetical protein